MIDHLCHVTREDAGPEHLEEKLRSLEIKISDLLDRRKIWETREYQLKKVLWMKTGELAVLSDFFNNQAHDLKEQ